MTRIIYAKGVELKVIEREISIYPEVNGFLEYVKKSHSENVDFMYVNSGSTVIDANRGIGLRIEECCLDNGASIIYSIDVGDTGRDFDSLPRRFPNQFFALKADVT